MADRADAHIHLFEHAYRGSFTARAGVAIDEAACYASLMADHDIKAALVVGYAADPWCAGNNKFIADAGQRHGWVHPAAFVDLSSPLSVPMLEAWRVQRFVGLSFYIFNDEQQRALDAIHEDAWSWLVEHRWLISINSRGELWRAWRRVLDRHGDLRLLVSHMGLPPRVTAPPTQNGAMADILALADYPGPRVKLSGFYAATDPGHDYPHRAAWPYVQWLHHAFGAKRLLWGSDFSPCLDWLTFPQTLGVFKHLTFFSDDDRRAIEGGNLLNLLAGARDQR